jgi:3',5'-cyclic AMP phosphodiesterase CpdA
VLIHCGDLTYIGQMDEYHQALDMLKEIDADVKLAIAGNHDLSLDKDFILSHRGRDRKPHTKQFNGLTEEEAKHRHKEAIDLWTAENGRAQTEGVRFLTEGLHRVELPNGSTLKLYVSQYTPEFCDWAFPYERNEDRFNPPALSLSDAETDIHLENDNHQHLTHPTIPGYMSGDEQIEILVTHGPP